MPAQTVEKAIEKHVVRRFRLAVMTQHRENLYCEAQLAHDIWFESLTECQFLALYRCIMLGFAFVALGVSN
jgi:hypothetical protein